MSLVPTIFSSTDASAPALSGQAGSLATLLDAILVDGYGSGPSAKSPLGWTREYTATNVRAYRGSVISGSSYCFRVDDSNARYALVRGFSSMSDIDTGNDPTPSAAVRANGNVYAKSSAASATARAWWAIGNERCLYLFVDVAGRGISEATPMWFGDFISLKPGDIHNFAISNAALTTFGGSGEASRFFYAATSADSPHDSSAAALVIARRSSDVVGTALGRHIMVFGVASNYGNGAITFPLPAGNGMLYERCLFTEAVNAIRGYLPGIYSSPHTRPLFDFEAHNGLLSKSFCSWAVDGNTGTGQILFETGVPWE